MITRRWLGPQIRSLFVPLAAGATVAVVLAAGLGHALQTVIVLAIATIVLFVIFEVIGRVGSSPSRRDVADMLRGVLVGATDHYDVDYLTSISLHHDPLLEAIQMEFLLLMEERYFFGAAEGYLFNQNGLEKIRHLVERLEQAERA